jgi:hypothetical protein
MRASYDHHSVPLCRRAVGRVLEIQTGAVGWLSGTVSLLIGGFILATFLALFNYLTPSGRVTVTGRVAEVTPNVTGQIVAIPVKPNVPIKAARCCFKSTRRQVEILKSNCEQAGGLRCVNPPHDFGAYPNMRSKMRAAGRRATAPGVAGYAVPVRMREKKRTSLSGAARFR